MKNKYLSSIEFSNLKIIFTLTLLMISFFQAASYSQWQIVYSDELIDDLSEQGISYQKRQGHFSTEAECLEMIERAVRESGDPNIRRHMSCEGCDEQNSSDSYNDEQQNFSGQNPPELVIDDYETQMMKIDLFIEKDKNEKADLDKSRNDDIKNDLLSKLKGNKSFNQLRTTSDLSEEGLQSIKNNQNEVGRENSESAFSDGKIKPNRRELRNNNITVSPPAPVESQKNLFEYIDRETKVVQTKIVEVQKEKIQILEKKNQIQQKIGEQTINIKKLEIEKVEVKEEARKEEIDSLLLESMQLLEESENLNRKAGEELETSNKLISEQEGLLNNLQSSYEKGKENPEKSEALLRELQGGKK